MHNLHELGGGLPVVDGYVLSHWLLDLVSHSADLPLLFRGSPIVGLGLESSLAIGLVMDLSLWAAPAAICLLTRRRTCLKVPGA